jgi:hypothetical protein
MVDAVKENPGTSFINQHLLEKEGRAEYDQWSTLVAFSDGKEPEARVLVVTSLCVYLFQSTAFKKSVAEAPMMQLAVIDTTVGDNGESPRSIYILHFILRFWGSARFNESTLFVPIARFNFKYKEQKVTLHCIGCLIIVSVFHAHFCPVCVCVFR